MANPTGTFANQPFEWMAAKTKMKSSSLRHRISFRQASLTSSDAQMCRRLGLEKAGFRVALRILFPLPDNVLLREPMLDIVKNLSA